MYARKISVVLGSLLVGGAAAGLMSHLNNGSGAGLALGIGLALILVGFVRD